MQNQPSSVANQIAGKVASTANLAVAPILGAYNGATYSYSPNGSGGVNYFANGNPITNTIYAQGTGQDTGSIEQQVASQNASNTVNPATSSTGTTSTTSSVDPNQVALYNTAINTLQDALNRSGNQLGIADQNINTQYGTNVNELNTAKANANQSYDTSSTQNGQQLQTNKNTIADQASAGLRGLLRTLGAYGAGGSSDALYTAPQAVAGEATSQRNGANQNFATNQQGLDTNWNNFINSDASSRQQLNDWQTQQLNSAQAQSDTAKQSLLQQLATLQGQKAAYAGGNSTAAAQPYLDQANGLSSTIDNLAAINPTYNGTTPTYTAPTLSSYVNNANTSTSINPTGTDSSVTPYLTSLLGTQKKTIGAA